MTWQVRTNLATSCAHSPVIVPAVFEELTSDKVLVMEFVEGMSLKDGDALRAAGIDCSQLAMRVCEAWAAQFFTDGVFNADAHAGNILATLSPTHGAVPVLLDFGLCKRLTKAELLALCKVCVASH
jgi:aarF domain-containing kinase